MNKKLYIANYIEDCYEHNYLIFVSTDEADRMADFLKMYESIQGEAYNESLHNSVSIYPITEETDADGNEYTITITPKIK